MQHRPSLHRPSFADALLTDFPSLVESTLLRSSKLPAGVVALLRACSSLQLPSCRVPAHLDATSSADKIRTAAHLNFSNLLDTNERGFKTIVSSHSLGRPHRRQRLTVANSSRARRPAADGGVCSAPRRAPSRTRRVWGSLGGPHRASRARRLPPPHGSVRCVPRSPPSNGAPSNCLGHPCT